MSAPPIASTIAAATAIRAVDGELGETPPGDDDLVGVGAARAAPVSVVWIDLVQGALNASNGVALRDRTVAPSPSAEVVVEAAAPAPRPGAARRGPDRAFIDRRAGERNRSKLLSSQRSSTTTAPGRR